MKRALCVCLLVAACGDDDDLDPAAVDASATADSASSPADAGRDASGSDAGLDASASDAGLDAGVDAGPSPATHQLYGVLDGVLYRIDRATAALTSVGETGVAAGEIIDAAYDDDLGRVRLMTGAYTAPRLASLDLCTGAVSLGERIARPNRSLLSEAEGIAIDPDSGTVYVSVDQNGSNNFVCETVGVMNVDTAVYSLLGNPDTSQDDVDQLDWAAGELIAVDIASALGTSTFYRVSTDDGASTRLGVTLSALVRFAYDPELAGFFATTSESPRRLVRVDHLTGAVTEVGATHAASDHAGLLFEAIFVAPPPTGCR